jgi:N-methylhydantoinase A
MKPTVTDAFLVCNYLNPDYFLGGRLRLQRDLARQAIGSISEKTGTELERTAEAILRIATSNMTFRIKSMASRLAFNVRECDLIAYGGASPTILPMILDEMSFRKAILPLSPGTFSAFGGLTADIMKDSVRSIHKPLNELGVEKIASLFSEMEEELEKWHSAQGLLAAKFRLVKSLELRYVRESFPIDIVTTDEQLGNTRILEDLFHAEHEQRYKIFDKNHPILVESLRMRLVGIVSRPPMIDIPAREPAQPISSRNIFVKGEWHEANVYRRSEMSPSDAVTGPAIIEQMDTTTIVPIGMKCSVEKNGLMIISK